MPKVDTDKFIALLIETYCRRMGIDRTIVNTILDDVLEKMGFKVENGNIVEIKPAAPELPNADKKPTNLADIGLSVRTLNILLAAGIKTVEDLTKLHKTDVLKFRNAGRKTLIELDDFFDKHGLEWKKWED